MYRFPRETIESFLSDMRNVKTLSIGINNERLLQITLRRQTPVRQVASVNYSNFMMRLQPVIFLWAHTVLYFPVAFAAAYWIPAEGAVTRVYKVFNFSLCQEIWQENLPPDAISVRDTTHVVKVIICERWIDVEAWGTIRGWIDCCSEQSSRVSYRTYLLYISFNFGRSTR